MQTLHPPLSKKAERLARKTARLEAKALEERTLAELKQRASELCRTMPPAYQYWGVVKTRAYVKMMVIVRHKASLKTIKSARLASFVQRLTSSEKWSLEYCQALSQLSARTKDASVDA